MREEMKQTRAFSVRVPEELYQEAMLYALASPAGSISAWVRYIVREEIRWQKAQAWKQAHGEEPLGEE